MKRVIPTAGLILGVAFIAVFSKGWEKTPAQIRTQDIVLGERIEIHSALLNEDRKILIRLPGDYQRSEQKYPVLYLLDGEFFFEQAAAAVRFLSELGYIQNQPIRVIRLFEVPGVGESAVDGAAGEDEAASLAK